MSQTAVLVNTAVPSIKSCTSMPLTRGSGTTDGEILPRQLLSTKVMVPTSPHRVIARSRLLDLLDTGMNGKLTLVSAPAGFGKTTLLSTWVRSRLSDRSQVAWVTLDRADNDPVQFWEYVLMAMDHCKPGVSAQALHVLHAAEPPHLEQVLVPFINALTRKASRTVLILDDYHLINEPAIHRSFSFLMDHLPSHVHLVLATRTTPPLPVARLRAGRQIMEVCAEQLRATEEETQAFLEEVMNVPLAPTAVAEIAARTEGWLAGLHLLGLSQHSRAIPCDLLEEVSGNQRYICDYVTEEVLGQHPAALQDFLLKTSLLSRLCAPLCDAVLERTDSQQMLEEIERANLFVISLDMHRGWYRYHPLFAESLRARLERGANEEVQAMHLRASRWYLEQGEIRESLRYAFSAHAWEFAADVIEQNDTSLIWGKSEGRMLLRLMEQFPEEFLQTHPRLCLASAQAQQSALAHSATEDELLTTRGGPIIPSTAHALETNQQFEDERNTPDELESWPGKRCAPHVAAPGAHRGQASLTWRQNGPTDSRPLQQVARCMPQQLLDPLSTREQEVLSLLAGGASNQEIAEILVVALCTVKHHVSNILSKLGASNRTHAIVQARALGLLSDV